MNFIEATSRLMQGKRIISTQIVNGEAKELVLECRAVFVRTPRTIGARPDNYIFSSPTAEEIISDEWVVADE